MAVINVMLEIHEVLDTGECSGKIILGDELKENGIESAFLLSVTGYNKKNCLKKLKQKIEEFNSD
jgi:hypothetical protein